MTLESLKGALEEMLATLGPIAQKNPTEKVSGGVTEQFNEFLKIAKKGAPQNEVVQSIKESPGRESIVDFLSRISALKGALEGELLKKAADLKY